MPIKEFNLGALNPNIGHPFLALPARPEGVSNSTLFAFDQTESGLWFISLPDYASGLSLDLPTWMKVVNSGKVDFEVEIMEMKAGASVNVASFDAVNEVSGGTTVAGTAEFPTWITIPCSNDDSPSGGRTGFYIRIPRDHDDADDTATNDAAIGPVPIIGSYTTT